MKRVGEYTEHPRTCCRPCLVIERTRDDLEVGEGVKRIDGRRIFVILSRLGGSQNVTRYLDFAMDKMKTWNREYVP